MKNKRLNVNIIIKQYKMINSDDVIKENIKEHNPYCPQIPDHP